jgi:hypothetical protein
VAYWRRLIAKMTYLERKVIGTLCVESILMILVCTSTVGVMGIICSITDMCFLDQPLQLLNNNPPLWDTKVSLPCPKNPNTVNYPHVYKSSKNFTSVKVKFSLEQATKAQRGSRGIALLFL